MHTTPLAIFAALEDEIRIAFSKIHVDEIVSKRPAKIIRGQYIKRPLLLVRTGIGDNAMAQAVDYICKNFHPELCINVGYCGGADPKLIAGDLVVADRVVSDETEEEVRIENSFVDLAGKCCERAELRYSVGGLVMVKEAVLEPHEKAFMGTKHGVLGIDMESFAFMKTCSKHNAKSFVIRPVIDPMDLRLPEMGDAIDEEGNTDIVGAIKHVIKHPKDILSLPRMESCAIQARESIAQFIDAFMSA